MQTLKQALHLIRSGKGLQAVYRCGIAGCPVGSWPETMQAMLQLDGVLPPRGERSYTLDDIVAALYSVDHADRYQLREVAK